MGTKVYAAIMVLAVAGSSVCAGSRFSVGPTIALGSGRMSSGAIEESLDRRAAMDAELKDADATAWLGYSFAGGATFTWHFSDRWAAEAGLTYNYLANTIEQELTEDDAHEVLSYREHIESKARFTTMWLQIPLAARFTLSPEKPYYVRAGLALDLFANAKIESEEEVTAEDWENGRLMASTTVVTTVTAEVDDFEPIRAELLLGAGRTISFSRSSMDIAVEVSVPLTTTELYTTDPYYANNTELNDIYSLTGSIDALQDTGIRLDDFRYSTIRVIVSYQFGLGSR